MSPIVVSSRQATTGHYLLNLSGSIRLISTKYASERYTRSVIRTRDNAWVYAQLKIERSTINLTVSIKMLGHRGILGNHSLAFHGTFVLSPIVFLSGLSIHSPIVF
jgi:hypothetical protein